MSIVALNRLDQIVGAKLEEPINENTRKHINPTTTLMLFLESHLVPLNERVFGFLLSHTTIYNMGWATTAVIVR